MDNRIQGPSAYDQTQQARETSDRQRLDQLILGGPGLVEPQQRVANNDDDGLRPEDTFEVAGAEAAAQLNAVQPPPVGAPLAQAADDVVLPVDGRGAAVTLQVYLQDLQDKGETQQFKATAEALGVPDVEAFERAVEQGNALQTFSHVDASRISFADQNFNEVDPDNLAAVANAQLVIRPSFEAAVAPEVENPEITLLNVNERIRERQETPLNASPTEFQRSLQTEPQNLTQNDGAAAVVG